MSWTDAVTSLRILLSDGARDKLRWKKAALGECNGTNATFKTFEFRRITDFTGPDSPEGVYVNGALSTVTEDFNEVGQFTLSSAPAQGSTVEATYYSQWFTDAELEQFLTQATQWLGNGDDYTITQSGLRPAALKYSEAEAYKKLAIRYMEWYSQQYRMEDAQAKERDSLVESWMNASQVASDLAFKQRDDFYKRQGRSNAPFSTSLIGAIPIVQPRR